MRARNCLSSIDLKKNFCAVLVRQEYFPTGKFEFMPIMATDFSSTPAKSRCSSCGNGDPRGMKPDTRARRPAAMFQDRWPKRAPGLFTMRRPDRAWNDRLRDKGVCGSPSRRRGAGRPRWFAGLTVVQEICRARPCKRGSGPICIAEDPTAIRRGGAVCATAKQTGSRRGNDGDLRGTFETGDDPQQRSPTNYLPTMQDLQSTYID